MDTRILGALAFFILGGTLFFGGLWEWKNGVIIRSLSDFAVQYREAGVTEKKTQAPQAQIQPQRQLQKSAMQERPRMQAQQTGGGLTAEQAALIPEMPIPTVNGEICDGIDDNKDGRIDEGWDTDGDAFTDCFDNCPFHANHDQDDSDGDGFGDVCGVYNENTAAYIMTLSQFCDASQNRNRDSDGDRIPDCQDNCPFHVNPKQEDVSRIVMPGEVYAEEGINIGVFGDELGGDACEKIYIRDLAPYIRSIAG